VTSRSPSTSAPTTPPPRPDLSALRDLAPSAGILLDFDGSLAEIVARPELATPVAGAREALATLVDLYRIVAIVTGRRSEEITPMLDAPGVRLLGVYGLEDVEHEPVSAALIGRVRAAAAPVPAPEDKRAAVAHRGRPTTVTRQI
jgi:trehalose-phosphatase